MKLSSRLLGSLIGGGLLLCPGPLMSDPAPAASEAGIEADWAAFQTLRDSRPPASVSSTAAYHAWAVPLTAQISEAADQFARKHPTDPRRWEAALAAADWQARTAATAADAKAPPPALAPRLRSILAAPDASRAVQAGASLALLQETCRDVASGTLTAQEWITAVTHHTARFPDFAKNNVLIPLAARSDSRSGTALLPALASCADSNLARQAIVYEGHVSVARATALGERDPATARTQLASLATNAQPWIAEAGTVALTQLEAKAALTDKPLDLSFTAVDGRAVDLAQLRGKVVLIDFWASWCGPCLADLPHIRNVYAQFHDKGFEIIGISLDKDQDALLITLAEERMTWPQYFDGLGWDNALAKRFNIRSIPALWLVNKQGRVVSFDARKNLEAAVKQLLAE